MKRVDLMGASHGDFVKYPRTPHLFAAQGTEDDRRLGETESLRLLENESLIVEEKIDGTNVGIHFAADGEMVLQCRGHLITEGMHPQYDLFKQWSLVKRQSLEERLQDRYILFGEWVYARHSIFYQSLSHYFFEFDIYDKQQESFIALEARLELLAGGGIETVPILHTGSLSRSELESLITASAFDSRFQNPLTGATDNRMEGLYVRTEADGLVTARAKMVRPEFVEKVKQSSHWQYEPMTPNELAAGVDIWS